MDKLPLRQRYYKAHPDIWEKEVVKRRDESKSVKKLTSFSAACNI